MSFLTRFLRQESYCHLCSVFCRVFIFSGPPKVQCLGQLKPPPPPPEHPAHPAPTQHTLTSYLTETICRLTGPQPVLPLLENHQAAGQREGGGEACEQRGKEGSVTPRRLLLQDPDADSPVKPEAVRHCCSRRTSFVCEWFSKTLCIISFFTVADTGSLLVGEYTILF